MFEEYIGQKVVIDLSSPYVCLGTLIGFNEHVFELKSADLHDLRDTETTREIYIVQSRDTGIKRNRRRLLLFRRDVVSISRLEDVVDE